MDIATIAIQISERQGPQPGAPGRTWERGNDTYVNYGIRTEYQRSIRQRDLIPDPLSLPLDEGVAYRVRRAFWQFGLLCQLYSNILRQFQAGYRKIYQAQRRFLARYRQIEVDVMFKISGFLFGVMEKMYDHTVYDTPDGHNELSIKQFADFSRWIGRCSQVSSANSEGRWADYTCPLIKAAL